MIYTVTFNPSIDYVINVDSLGLGATNRAALDTILPGGKGINVSFIIKELGNDSVAVTFTGGFTGEEIKRGIEERGISGRFFDIGRGRNRINIKIKERKETEINADGPVIGEEAMEAFWNFLDSEPDVGDVIVLGGSVPASVPKDTYKKILRICNPRGIKVVVDASGDILNSVVNEKPFLIKPNQDELAQLFGVRVNTLGEADKYAKKLT